MRRQLSDGARQLLLGALTNHPIAFQCPITLELMTDPVVLADGHTYEREAIESWLKSKRTSPVTGARLSSTVMVANFALRSSIEDFVAQRDAVQQRQETAEATDRHRESVLEELARRTTTTGGGGGLQAEEQ